MQSVKQARIEAQDIRREVKMRAKEYYARGVVDPLYEEQLNYLLHDINFNSRARKAELLNYKQEAVYFLEWDEQSSVGVSRAAEKERKAYESFRLNVVDMSYTDWRHLVNIFGALGADALEYFGYGEGKGASGSISEAYMEAKKEGKQGDFLHALQNVIKKSKREDFTYHKTPSGLLEALWDELGVTSEESRPKRRR